MYARVASPAFLAHMNIHEYQAKQLFERFRIPTPPGAPAETPEEAEKVARDLRTSHLVVKGQIRAGGRDKGPSRHGFTRGGPLCPPPPDATELGRRVLG